MSSERFIISNYDLMIVKKLFALLSLLLPIHECCQAQSSVLIEGYAPKMKDGTELLLQETNLYNSGKPLNIYTMVVRKGKFKGKFKSGNGDEFWISKGNDMKSMYLQPGKLKIEIPDTSLSKIIMSGNLSEEAYASYQKDLKSQPFYTSTYKFQEEMLSKNTPESKTSYDSAMVVYHKSRTQFVLDHIKEKPDSYLNSNLLFFVKESMTRDEFAKHLNNLNADSKSNHAGKYLKFLVDSLDIGGTLPGFAKADTSGNLVQSKSFAGKYVLIDFWASWCIPCRQENPNLKAAYTKFHPKNFSIVSISIDEKKDSWLKAVKEDNLEWTQLIDATSDVYKKLALNKVPSNFLIGPKGEIIAKDLRGDDLWNALEKVLK